MSIKLTKNQREMMDFISYCDFHHEPTYIETGSHKRFNAQTLKSLLRKGLVQYEDGGTSYRSASFHIIVKTVGAK